MIEALLTPLPMAWGWSCGQRLLGDPEHAPLSVFPRGVQDDLERYAITLMRRWLKRSGEGSAVEIQELRRLRPALDRFVARFDDNVKTEPSRRHMRTYLNGQLGPLERKSIEPIALDAGVHPRNLQEFLSIHRWDDQAVERRLREIARQDHPDENAIGVIDETSFAKKGTKTAGVQRQHCGSTGKTDNCVVTVHLGYVTRHFHCLIDGDLYLPEETWSKDRERCREAGIPDDVVYRPKWKIALEILEGAIREGVRMRWLTADEG